MTQKPQIESKQPNKSKATGTQAVDRTLHLLELIAAEGGPISLQTLCKRSGLNRTTAWRLLSTLEAHRYVERNPHTKEYDLGIAVSLLCTSPQRRYESLIRYAQPEMEALANECQESVMLSVLHANCTTVIHQIDPISSVRLKDYLNQPSPLWGTSNGKIALATFTPSELDLFFQESLTAFTANTIVEPTRLREEIEKTRQQGYGMVEGEWNIEENAISAPIFINDSLFAFLGIGGPRFRFTREKMEAIAPALCSACTRLTTALSNIHQH